MAFAFGAALFRCGITGQHRRRGIDWLVPELRVNESLAQVVNIGRNVRERVEWKQFDDEDISRLVGIVGMGADEMPQFFSTPPGIDIVLREEQEE